MIMTRWHLDDPVGRLIERFPEAKIFRYPAIAEEDEKNRSKGEALFPEHKSLSFLIERKKAMTQASWESEYQQNPIVVGGGMFPIEKIRRSCRSAQRCEIKRIRALLGQGGHGGRRRVHRRRADALAHAGRRFVVGDVRRGRWSALDRERVIKRPRDGHERFPDISSVWSRSQAPAARSRRRRRSACSRVE